MDKTKHEKANQTSTQRLVLAAVKGDTRAFETLYNQFFPRISRFVSLRVNHLQTAEDLTAEVFIKAWASLRQTALPSSFSSWIFTIARNTVIDYWRTKKSFSDLFELENLLFYEDQAIQTIDLNLAAKELLKTLKHLTGDQQQVLRLKFLEDLDNEEIAAIMNKTSGTIRVIQHRAIVNLKKYLPNSLL